MTLVHWQLVAVFDRALDLVDLGKVDHRVDALGEDVQPQGDQVDVAGALAVAEEAALDPVGAGQHAQLGGGHSSATVVVRVQAEDDRLAPGQVPVHPLDRVGVDVRRGHLDGGRQVDDQWPVRGRVDHVDHRGTDLQRVLQLGACVGLRRVLVEDLGVRGVDLGVFLAEPGAARGDVGDPGLVQAEHDPALQCRRRVVEVDDGPLGPADRLERALDQMLAALGQDLDRHVVRDQVLLDELADEVVVGLAGRRETDLDLLVAHPDQQVEHAPLAFRRHRVDQGLVAVAQVDRAPARGGLDALTRPLPVGQLDGELLLIGRVALERHLAGALTCNGIRRHGFLS